jgi:hypothetical protein
MGAARPKPLTNRIYISSCKGSQTFVITFCLPDRAGVPSTPNLGLSFSQQLHSGRPHNAGEAIHAVAALQGSAGGRWTAIGLSCGWAGASGAAAQGGSCRGGFAQPPVRQFEASPLFLRLPEPLQDVMAGASSWRATSAAGPHLLPSERVLHLWRSAQAVCFDIDCEFSIARPTGARPKLPASRVRDSCTACCTTAAASLLGGRGAAGPRAFHCYCCFCWLTGLLPRLAPSFHPYAGTVAKNDQLDLLAEFMGVGGQVAALTNSVRRLAPAGCGMHQTVLLPAAPCALRPAASPPAKCVHTLPSLAFPCRLCTLSCTLCCAGHGWQHVA